MTLAEAEERFQLLRVGRLLGSCSTAVGELTELLIGHGVAPAPNGDPAEVVRRLHVAVEELERQIALLEQRHRS
jgi:hypothetical protein